MVDIDGNPTPARLYVRVTQDSASIVAGDAIKQAQSSAGQLLQPLVSNVSDAVTNFSDTVVNQQNLVTSFDALMKQFAPLVKIGDEIAKVCSVSSSLLYDLNRSCFLKRSILMLILRGKCSL